MASLASDQTYALRRLCFCCTIFYLCLFSLTAASWLPKRREQLWRDRLWLYYVAALPPIFAVVRCVLLHKRPVPYSLIDVFDPLVYVPMTLVILGFTEAALRKTEHRLLFMAAAAFISLVMFAETGWSIRGYLACGNDSTCLQTSEDGQLYFYLGWAVIDCAVTAGFVLLLYKSMATMHRARWHIIALGLRSLSVIVMAVVGLTHKSQLTREAQVDLALATSVCFLVVRAFRSLVGTAGAQTRIYPTRHGEQSGGRTKRSIGRGSPEPSTSSQQHINVLDDRDGGSTDADGDIELETITPVPGRGDSGHRVLAGGLGSLGVRLCQGPHCTFAEKAEIASSYKAVVLVTGANTGIGYETVKALLRSERAFHVILGGRDFSKAHQATETVQVDAGSQSSVTPVQIDVESDESIKRAYLEVERDFGRLDCLINNAGAAFDAQGKPASDSMTLREAFAKTWDVNFTGAHMVTLTFMPLLLKSADPRLLFITSGASSLAEASTPGHLMARKSPPGLPKILPSMAYRSSKVALNMMMLQWHNALVEDGVKVFAVAPGLLATGLGGNPEALKKMGAGDPKIGGEAIKGVVEGNRDSDAGKVVREYGESNVIPW